MPVTTTAMRHVISYRGLELAFPVQPAAGENPDCDKAKRHYTTRYPDIATAIVTGPEARGTKLVWTFSTHLGSKG